MAMSNRERILAILDRKSPDRIPWIARLDLWYHARMAEGNMPARFRGMSLVEVGRALRTGNPARDGKIFSVRYEGLEVRNERAPGVARQRFITPHGEVTFGRILSEKVSGTTDQGLPLEHPIHSVDDYKVLEYIAEHTYYDPCYDQYLEYEAAVGDEGYPMVSCGDVPFHYFLLHLAGYNQAYFEMVDHAEEFERLITVMEQVDRERLWPVVADSPARLILHGVHFDSQMTPPHMFRKYMTPYYKDFSALLHSRGKSLTWHADDDSKDILAEVKAAGFDMSECFCTSPMVEVTLEEARAAWGTDVTIFGGVPSIVLEPTYPDVEFEAYLRGVFRTIAPGDAFILGVADNVMPTSLIERVERISDFVEQYGTYPIQPD